MVSYLKHYFSVNTAEKVVVKQSEWKITVAQYEQDATCLVFDMPRYIDGHDMLACNAKEVHYTTRGGGLGVYEIVDAALKRGSDKIITFSWYLSGIATENVGPLSFVIRFAEIENSNPTNILFDWYTLSNDKDIEITAGMNNGEPVIEPHVDILNQWRMALLADTIISLKQIKISTESLGENIWEATFKDGRKEQLVIRNGAEGHTPEAGVDYYTPEEIEKIKLELQEYIDEVVSQTEFEGGAGEITGNNNEIFNVYEDVIIGNWVLVKNQAIGIATHAEGAGTIAGAKAFIIKGSRNVELDAPIDETIPESNVIGIYTLDSVNGIEIGDEFSIQYKSNYDCWGTVIAIGPSESFDLAENEIAAYGAVPDDPNYSYENNGDPELWFHNKPTIGTTPFGTGQHAEGEGTKAVGPQAHAEGYFSIASGKFSHAEGRNTFAAYCAHAEGTNTIASGERSHAQGFQTIAAGYTAHAEGNKTQAIGSSAHAGGAYSLAAGLRSFAHGWQVEASGSDSVAFGWKTKAIGANSFAVGQGTEAVEKNQFVAGAYNADRAGALAIVGNGKSANARSNAFVVLEDGSAEVSLQGDAENSVVIKSSLDTAVKEIQNNLTVTNNTINKIKAQSCIQDKISNIDIITVTPDMTGEYIISTSKSGDICKFGVNLIAPTGGFEKGGVTCSVQEDRSGIVLNGTATATNWGTTFSFHTNYYPTGHYTFFVEGLSEAHASSKVYVILKGVNEASIEVELARVSASNPVVEFDMPEPMTQCKMGIVIKAGETFDNELVKFQLQAGTKTEFEPRKMPITIQTVAGEDAVIAVDDLEPFTLISQTEGNTITCKYPVSTKSYIDKKIGAIESSLDEIIKIQEDLITPNGDEVSY